MQADIAIRALGALAQEHRLATFRLLVRAGDGGMAAGALAEALGLAGLVSQRRQSRSIIYSADYAAMGALMGYLTENCCGGASCAAPAASTDNERSAA
jgi:ArsR family transcriptional regulator